MKIAICPICEEPIRNDEKIAVLSYPLQSIGTEADYSLMGDFIDNEKVVHYDCFREHAEELSELLSKNASKSEWIKTIHHKVPLQEKQTKVYDLEHAESFRTLLASIGENVSIKQINDFILSNQGIKENEKLLSIWLRDRNSTHLCH